MQKVNESNLETVIHEFLNAGKDLLEWKWDSRFETALAEFVVAEQEKVKEVLSGFFGEPWNTNNIIGAPTEVKAIDFSFGSLMYGQELLTSDPNENLILYCMWWPWGNGERVSVRVGVHYGEPKEDAAQKLRAWFGLE